MRWLEISWAVVFLGVWAAPGYFADWRLAAWRKKYREMPAEYLEERWFQVFRDYLTLAWIAVVWFEMLMMALAARWRFFLD